MKILRTVGAFLILATSVGAQTFPLDPNLWLLDPQQPDQGVVFAKKGTLAFNFPLAGDPGYTGYLLLPWTQAITGFSLEAQVQLITFPSGDKPVRFIPAPGSCISEARAYLFFQSGDLYNGIEGTQWWANLDSWPLVDTGAAVVTVQADLTDPSRWYSVYGHSATGFPAEFANALAHPSYVGLTFGGNCANGHGVQTGKGSAQFRLVTLNAL